jgi:transketolase
VVQYSNDEDVLRLIKDYGIHCDRRAGCDASTGSLGHGIGIATGMALADRSKNVYCLLSDGECSEGSVYETLETAHEQNLSNLKVYINCNGWGAYKALERDHIIERFRAFTKVNISFTATNLDDYPKWLQGQIAHYKVLDEKDFNELMEVLK